MTYTVVFYGTFSVSIYDFKTCFLFDGRLTSEVPLLEQAIQRRFGEKPQTLLKRLSVLAIMELGWSLRQLGLVHQFVNGTSHF